MTETYTATVEIEIEAANEPWTREVIEEELVYAFERLPVFIAEGVRIVSANVTGVEQSTTNTEEKEGWDFYRNER